MPSAAAFLDDAPPKADDYLNSPTAKPDASTFLDTPTVPINPTVPSSEGDLEREVSQYPALASGLAKSESQTSWVDNVKDTAEKTLGTIEDIPVDVANTAMRMTGRGAPITRDTSLLPQSLIDAGKSAFVDTVTPNHPTPMSEGLAESGAKVVQGLASPAMIESLPLFEFRAGRIAFSALMASQTPAQLKQTYDVLSDPNSTPTEKWTAGGDAFANIAMQAALALHLGPDEVKTQFTPEEAAKIAGVQLKKNVASTFLDADEPVQFNQTDLPTKVNVTDPALAATANQIAPLSPLTADALKSLTQEPNEKSNPDTKNNDAQQDTKPNAQENQLAVEPQVNALDQGSPVGTGNGNDAGQVAPVADKAGRLNQLKALPNPTPDEITERDSLQAESDAKRKADWGAGFAKSQAEALPPQPTTESEPNEEKNAQTQEEVKPTIVDQPVNNSPFKPGQKVSARLSAGLNKFHDAVVLQVQPDGDLTVQFTSGPHEGKSQTLDGSLVQDTAQASGRKNYEQQFSDMTQPERAKAKRDSKSFDDLIRNEGHLYDWFDPRYLTETETAGQRMAAQDAFKDARAKAFKDASIQGDPESAVDRAKGLDKLQKFLDDNREQATHQVDVDNTSEPEYSSTDFLPPEPTPKLAPGVKQGDLLASTQKEDLSLMGEKASDGERIASAKAKAERDTAEAKQIADKQQQGFVGMGGAVPSEFERSPQTPTGIKNATVDAERAKRGLPPAVEPARKSFGEVWDRTMARVDREPDWLDGRKGGPIGLLEELRRKPRALTDEEDAAILQRQIDLQNDYGKATRDLKQAFNDGDEGRMQEAKVRTAHLSDQLLDIYNIGKQVGTETGRGLNARKMMAFEDFSLAQMELSSRASKGGAELSDDERGQIQKLHDKIAETQKAYDDYRAKQESEASQRHADEAIRQAKADAVKEQQQPKIHPKILEAARKIVDKIHTEADKSRAILLKRLGNTNISADPTTLYHVAVIGADHLANAALEFGEWSAKMAGDLGEIWDKVKGDAKEIYAASQKRIDDATKDNPLELARAMRNKSPEEQIEANTEKIAEKVKAGKKGDITGQVQRIARLLVQSGVTDREKLIDRVHSILQKSLPDISRRETMDAISGYGDFKQISKDQVSVQLRGLKGEMQQIAKLEDMQAGTPPLKTGVERRTPTDMERELIKKVNDAKNKFRVPMTDAATQLKSALDTVKTRLQNEIADLERQIAAKAKTIKEKSTTPTDAASEALRARRDELKAEYKQLFDDPEVAYQKALQEYKNRTQRNIYALQDRIKNGDYAPRQKPELKLDNEAMRLKADNERLKQQFQQGLARNRLAQRKPWQKTMDAVVKWRRGFILSGPVTLAKLTTAAIARAITTPLEEGVGSALHMAFPALSERAPREGGGMNLHAEVKAITEGLTNGAKDAWQTLRTGKSNLELTYGKDKGLPQSFIDIFGNIHGALKAPVKRMEFARSLEKRLDFYARQGADVTDEFVQMRAGIEAYQDAQRAIFMQKNILTDAYKRALSRFDQADKTTGQPTAAGKVAGTTARVLMPIVKVPVNIVAETMQYAIGSITVLPRLGKAYYNGIQNLKPEEADLILRQIKKGSLGGAIMLLGYFNPKMFGGFYQQGEKRPPADVPSDAIKVNGVTVPSQFIHNPLMGAGQLGATIERVADSKLRKKDAQTQGLTSGAIAGAIGLADATPFLREAGDVAKILDPSERTKYEGELAKSMLVPQAVQSLANFTDRDANGKEIKRKPVTVMQSIKTGIPGARQTVPRNPKQ